MHNLLKKIIFTGMVTERYNGRKELKKFRGLVTVKDAQDCIDCGACRFVCPVGAIKMKNGKLRIDHKACVFCGRCIEKCQAISQMRSDAFAMANFSQDTMLEPQDYGADLKQKVRARLGRSLRIRYLDIGSCNGCCVVQMAEKKTDCDLTKYCIEFVDSPCQADVLMVTGADSRQLSQSLLMSYNAMKDPKLIMAVGACAAGGQSFQQGFSSKASVASVIPVDIYVPGCPVKLTDVLYGLLLAVDKIADKRTVYSISS